jgi:hypothetical protein
MQTILSPNSTFTSSNNQVLQTKLQLKQGERTHLLTFKEN